MLPSGCGERFICALENPLSPDVSPRTSSHLSEHYQALLFQLVEVIACRPFEHKHAVDNQDPRCHPMSLEDRHRLPALDKKSVLLPQLLERSLDRLKSFPCSSGSSCSTVDDQLIRVFRHIRLQNIVEHSQSPLNLPISAVQSPTRDQRQILFLLQSGNGLCLTLRSQWTLLPSLTTSFPSIRTLSTNPSPYV